MGDNACATRDISNLIILLPIAGFGGDGGIQRPNFLPAKRPPFSRGEPVIVEGAEPGPDEAADRVADRLAHPADLAVAALVDHDLHRRSGGGRLRHPDPGGGGPAVVEVDTLPEPAQGGPAGAAGHL